MWWRTASRWRCAAGARPSPFWSPGRAAPASGTGTVHYRDGSHSTYELTAPDWRSGPLSTKAVALPHINGPEGQSSGAARLYAVTVTLRAGREVSSVVLPKASAASGTLHVFAVSVRDTGRGRTGSWAASTAGYRAVGPWTDRTLRLVVHSGAGGPRARIRIANTFAATPVEVGAASIAVRGAGAAADGAPVPLTFGQGRTGTRIPAGAEAFSDPGGPHRPARRRSAGEHPSAGDGDRGARAPGGGPAARI